MRIIKNIPNNTYMFDILDYEGSIHYFYNHYTPTQARVDELHVPILLQI